MMKRYCWFYHFIKLASILLLVLSMSSCTSSKNNRLLKKFISRFNANEYSCAATYLYPEDHVQFAFFTRVIGLDAPQSYIEVKETKTVGDKMIITLKWNNATNELRQYFRNIGKPFESGNILKDTLSVRQTIKGKKLSFQWVYPEMRKRNLRIAKIRTDTVEMMNIRLEPSTRGKIVGQIEKDHDVFIYDDCVSDWSECYFISPEQAIQIGYIYTKNMDIEDSGFFSLSIFDSMSLLVALLIAVVIAVPLFYIRGIAEAVSQGGCLGVGVTIVVILGLLYVLYQALEKILFELFIINLPH